VHDSVAIQVTRGSESWQFYAFVFAAAFSFALAVLEDSRLPKTKWQRALAKTLLFTGCFYLFMINNWMRNHLATFLGWLKVENYSETTVTNLRRWYESSEWWLVVVGLVTAAFIAWQARETAGATKAMRDTLPEQKRAADAAKENADALKSAERPWLFLELPKPYFPEPSNRLDWKVCNRGRSVATVLEVGLTCKKCRGVENLLPEPPDYSVRIDFHDVPLAPSGALDAWCHIGTGEEKFGGLSQEDVKDILEKGCDLVAFGFVKYRDQFGEAHESRFCYYFAKTWGEFRINLVAPAAYHQCD